MTEEPRNYTVGPKLINFYDNLRRRGNRLIIVGLLLMLAISLLAMALQPQPQPDYSKLGVHLLLDDGRGSWPVDIWPAHMDAAAELLGEGGYVVQLVQSDDLDIDRWQVFMDLCAERGLIPVLRLATDYDDDGGFWPAPPADDDGRYTGIGAAYAEFVAGLDWPTDAHYVILLNEPNRGNEWGGQPDPAAYARFVMDVAAALREADPNVQILNGALDLYAPNTQAESFTDGFIYLDANSFLEAMIAAEPDVFRQIDVWNSHSYPMGAFREPPWTQTYQFDTIGQRPALGRPPRGIVNRGINGYTWELWKLNQFGIYGLPVMITETGWRHAETVDPDSLDAGDGYPDAETAARYLDLALRGNNWRFGDMPQSGWTPWLLEEKIIAVMPFALNGTPWEWGHTNWLKLSPEGDILGTYAPYDLIANIRDD